MKLKIRLTIARVINRMCNGVCWSDLVAWAYGFTNMSEVDFNGRCTRPPYYDKLLGGCYCGKHQCEDGEP